MQVPAAKDAPGQAPINSNCGISLIGLFCILALMLQNTTLVVSARYATAMRTGEPFSPSSLVLMTELGKLVVSSLLVHFTEPAGFSKVISEIRDHPRCCFKCFVPAASYTVSSIAVFYAIANLEVTLFQICNQGKMLATAMWSVAWLRRSISARKWFALFLQGVGILLCTQVSNKAASEQPQSMTFGLAAITTAVLTASFGGVYFEGLLKTDPRAKATSLWVRNVFLSLFSLFFAIPGFLIAERHKLGVSPSFEHLVSVFFIGYDVWAVVIIFLQVAGGLLVALSIKHTDSVMKSCATACAIVITGIVSFFLFGFVPSFMFLPGACLVIGSTVEYSRPDKPGATPGTSSIPPSPTPSEPDTENPFNASRK